MRAFLIHGGSFDIRRRDALPHQTPRRSIATSFPFFRRIVRAVHRPGEVAPMSLLTYEIVSAVGQSDQGRRS